MLTPCPNCGHTENAPRRNLGPTILQIDLKQYRAVCLNCWHKTQPAKSWREAADNWNGQQTTNRWKRRRLELGLSVKQLSDITGINHRQIYRYEADKVTPMPDTIEKLEQGLEMR